VNIHKAFWASINLNIVAAFDVCYSWHETKLCIQHTFVEYLHVMLHGVMFLLLMCVCVCNFCKSSNCLSNFLYSCHC